MILFLIFLWNDFYNGIVNPLSQNSRIITFGSNNFYLLDSLFINLIITGVNGGAIFLNSLTINLLIEKTSFYSCSSDKNGGAVYFSCTFGACIFNLICGEKCWGYNGHLIYIITSNSLKNEAHFLSCARCPNLNTLGYRNSLYFENGIQILKNINSSLNNIKHQTPGIIIYLPNSVTSNFCTISNNKVTEAGITIWLQGGSGIRKLLQWNIVANNSPGGYGIIFSDYDGSSFIMSHCIFKDNLNTLFSGGLTIEYCRIIHSGGIGAPNIISSNTLQTNTFLINHFSSYNCNADFNYILPTLKETPINTPSISNLPRTYMEMPSCKINEKLINLNILISIFII